MRWHEIRTRAGQEISKRVDLARYRAGMSPVAPRNAASGSSKPQFFFSGAEGRQRADLLKKNLPGEANAVIEAANGICRHEFRLLGFEKVTFGQEIDWHFNQGRPSIPLKPWYKIDFLDFELVGDHKIVWELNRHQHLVTLAKAWLLTGKAEYVNELVAQWYSWQRANPYPLGINWASSLEVGFRSLSWLWVRALLAECPQLPSNFEHDLLDALQLHGRHIERYLSRYFSPNTHLLGEAAALFFIGTLCPRTIEARRWLDLGWNILLEESVRQVRQDGIYFEQALYYHVYALDFFLHARILASANGIAPPQPFDDTLQKMLDVIQALSETGVMEGFGDDDGGRVFDSRRNRVECMSDPLAIGMVLYKNQYSSARLTEESIWLFGDRAIAAFENLAPRSEMRSRAFPAGGIYLINDPAPCVQQLMIDAGPQGTGRSGHGHADALSVRFSFSGQRTLIDCGTYRYISDGTERDHFRGTRAHNTLRVDNLEQAVSEGPFAWSSIPRVVAETWINGNSFNYFVGSHDGYRRLLDPVVHRRSVFHVRGGVWLVRDRAEGQSEHLLETFWHFDPEVEIENERGTITATPTGHGEISDRPRLTFLVDRNSGWRVEVEKDLASPAYGCKQVASALRISAQTRLPNECAVLFLLGKRVGDFSAFPRTSQEWVRGYRYWIGETSEFFFFADENATWRTGGLASDAKLLYCKTEGGSLKHVIMVSGSFAEWRGKRFISHSSSTETFEWLKRAGVEQEPSGSGDVLEDLVWDLDISDVIF
jgi:hypothetical protein